MVFDAWSIVLFPSIDGSCFNDYVYPMLVLSVDLMLQEIVKNARNSSPIQNNTSVDHKINLL